MKKETEMIPNEQIPEKSCWYIEGGLCYVDWKNSGRSNIKCNGKCEKYESKRAVLGRFIPNDKLIIVSERKDINERNDTEESIA
jgi:hypothetical protein